MGTKLQQSLCGLLLGILLLNLNSPSHIPNAHAEETGILTGTLWYDENANGARDPSEERASGAVIRLVNRVGSNERTEVKTDDDGNYTTRIAPGSYVLITSAIKPGRDIPPGLTVTHEGGTAAIAVAGETREASFPLTPQKGRVAARIEVVWPHDTEGKPKPTNQAPLANIGVYLFAGQSESLNSVSCNWNGTVRLWAALNSNPAQLIGNGDKQIVTKNGITFPQWEFNNVDVSSILKPANKMYFFVTVDSQDVSFDPASGPPLSASNVWAHATEARTYFPDQDTPQSSTDINEVDAKIEVVWPHDEKGNSRPIADATRVNVSTSLFQHGTTQGPAETWDRDVYLLVSRDNNPTSTILKGVRRVASRGGRTYPVWDFNDVELTDMNQPGNKYFFRTVVAGLPTYSNVWAHGADARTIFPKIDVPVTGCQP